MHRFLLIIGLSLLAASPVCADNHARAVFEASLAAEPDLSVVQKRAKLLVRWVNDADTDLSRISADFVPTISKAMSLQSGDPQTAILTVNEALHDLAYEMAVLEDDPGAAGSATWVDEGRLVAGETARLTQVYKVGKYMAQGAGLLLAKHWSYPWSLQANVPGANNYIRISSSAQVEFELNTLVRDGLHGGMHRPERLPYIEIVSGNLRKGDTIAIEYGAGPNGFLLPDEANDHFVLPIYVRLRADSPFVRVPVTSLRVEPGPPQRLHLAAPSIVRAGEAVTVAVRIEDGLGNVASGEFPSLEVLRDDTFVGRIPAGPSPLAEFRDIRFDDPGLHRVELRSSGGGLSATSNPILVVEGEPEYRIVWADLHRHTRRSDGIMTPGRLQEGALEDLLLAIDHDNYLTRAMWESIQVDTTVSGFEWSRAVDGGGHHVVLTRTPISADDVLRDAFPTLRSLMRGLTPENTLVIPLAEIPGDSRFQDPAMTRLLEIKSGESTFEWQIDRFSQAGYRLGLTGSATSHESRVGSPGNRGLTAIYSAPGESWWDALSQRRTAVTSGARMILRAELNGGPPGSRVAASDTRVIRGEVIGTAGIAGIDLIRNGELIDRLDVAADRDSDVVRVSMKSDSHPWQGQRDLPRNGREWIGYLRVHGGDIRRALAPGFDNSRRQAIASNPGEKNRLDFISWTRGHPTSFLVDIDHDESAQVMLELHLKSGFEDVDQIPRARPPQPTPAIRQQVDLADLRFGSVIRSFNVKGYQDQVAFDLVRLDLPVRRTFEFVDTREAGSVDYYYLRIRQIDDHILWSSPIWVGGFDIR